MELKENNYYNERLNKLGITPEHNKIDLWRDGGFDSETGQSISKLEPVEIFRKHPKGIEIIVYTLDRTQPLFSNLKTDENGKDSGDKKRRHWSIIRLENPTFNKEGKEMKYQMPKGAGSYPFFPPSLVEKFENKVHIKFLFITEGFFKAFKGAIHGLDIIGVPSITHLKSKDDGTMHREILEIIRICKVEKVIWLTDGDCFDLSKKAKEDKSLNLTNRPYSFYQSISTFRDLLDDLDCDKWFMHVDTANIVQSISGALKDEVKGLDDVMCKFPDKIEEIVKDATTISGKSFWFGKYNITISKSKVYNEFKFSDVNSFYLHYVELGQIEKNAEFVFFGTIYQYNEEDAKCKIIVPGDAKLYFRVGTQYYKFVQIPNKYNQLERQFHLWDKGTIKDDHGAKFLTHIPKYQGFCNVPDHTNYQQTPFNCFNVYCPLDFLPSEETASIEDCSTILGFVQHIFGNATCSFTNAAKEKIEVSSYEMGLDYMQLLYQKPTEKLPILCLVSKENNTGKSTFGKLLKLILGANCAIVGNQDLAGDFNKHWSTKALVICDETKIDKQAVIEKVKSLSTADKITMNSKGKDQVELDCFLKFIFITNNEENFIYASEDDIRYWVLKVKTIEKENPDMLDLMIQEIPAFLSWLNQRKLATQKLNRMWFHPKLLKTDALKKVIQYSRPTIEKELIQHIKDMFLDFGIDQILMSRSDIQDEFFKSKYEAGYIEKVLKENLKVEQYHEYRFKGTDYKSEELAISIAMTDMDLKPKNVAEALQHIKPVFKTKRYSYPRWDKDFGKKEKTRVEVSCNGRPYLFNRKDFVKTDDEVEVDAETSQTNSLVGNTQISDAEADRNDELPFPQ